MSTRWGYAASPSDGTRIFYSDDDRGDERTAVAFCDGIGCDGYVWRYLRPDLAPRRTLHAHYRGHGRSQPPRDPRCVTIAHLADDLAAVLDDAQISRVVLAGHSMGVQVALETWRRHPDRVAGLILICGAPAHPLRTFRGVRTLEDLLPLVERTVMRAPRIINALTRAVVPTRLAFTIAGLVEINRARVLAEDFMPYLEGIASVDLRVFLAILAAAGQHSAEEYLAGVDVPALVIAGARDGFTPPQRSVDMATRIPGADLMEIADWTHSAPIERPQEIDARIVEFLRTRVDAEN